MARPSLRPRSVHRLRQILLALSLGASLVTAGQVAWQKALESLQPPPPPPERLLFVPVGAFPEDWLADLVARYDRTLGLRVEVMPPIPIDPSIVDPERRQLIAEKVVLLIKDVNPTVADDPRVSIVGLTTHDMFIQAFSWRFAFGYREDDRIAVVSSARMDPTFFDQPANQALLEARFRKILAKNIGHVYYRRPLSRDRRSIMYGHIMGLDDLDYIREESR